MPLIQEIKVLSKFIGQRTRGLMTPSQTFLASAAQDFHRLIRNPSWHSIARTATHLDHSWLSGSIQRSTAFAWGGTAGAVALYVTDWTVVMQYVPFINKKYDHEIPQ